MLQGVNCKGIAFMEELVTEEYIKNKIPNISKSYPFLNWTIKGTKIYSGQPPKITCAELDECEETEFVTKCLSTFFTQEMNEIYIIKMKGTAKGAVLAVSCHCFGDAPLLGHLVSDLVSTKTDFPEVPKLVIEDLLKGIPDKHQTLTLSDPFIIPRNKEPKPGPLFYRGIARSFDASRLVSTCKSIGIRPQAFMSACDIYTISKCFNLSPNFNILNQVSINTRRMFGISSISPMVKSSLVYLESHITNETNMKDLMQSLQKQIDLLVPNYQLPHFKLLTYNKFDIKRPAAMISNTGIIESENADIWVQGGQYTFREEERLLQSFTSHACTSRGKCNIVFTFIHPGCDNEFVNKYVEMMMNLFENPEKTIELSIFE
ncbi:hypothetical protein GPJ56_002313 [Histomonas meleagridis]|uniref:uncharacterized protein n=1 Tax=Histomonas meleagridis TaxID=135588 RepID=UPI00355A4121|nr:hypothetical protein GPJ56_002313 [Histomonas meleagridis]KAH0804574.1 hypothetical protein GO595_003404 [Histomonas meleagridis]